MKIAGLEFELLPSAQDEQTWRCTGCAEIYKFTLFNISQMTLEVAAHSCPVKLADYHAYLQEETQGTGGAVPGSLFTGQQLYDMAKKNPRFAQINITQDRPPFAGARVTTTIKLDTWKYEPGTAATLQQVKAEFICGDLRGPAQLTSFNLNMSGDLPHGNNLPPMRRPEESSRAPEG